MASIAAARTIVQSAPVGPQIYAILRERIIHNELPPGTRVSESEIAANYSVSRQPVREAFIKLSEEGLMDVRPQRGSYIRKISTSAVMDARFVREAIEADIVRLVTEKHDESLDAKLKGQLALQREAASKDANRFIQLDELFHRTLAEAANKSGVWAMVEGLKAQMDRVRYLSLFKFPMHQLLEQHEAIAKAIARRDPVAAETAMRMHLREILKDLPAIAEEKPELFDTSGV
ncbi:FCD domain-containing protein [Stappia sp. GBMRC 2046]|uniref:FCD domain-containing protein n=1 Tax=Stappia sediminis TaxID=2692190 RepID=A0A7X3LWG2_9HYPH|nr:GntR family transcriptional regulator [Stappia sediminis]MXN66322.1 FCD domain-containing protein [Stappia sediminis]